MTPAILHMTEITGFAANGTQTVTLDIGADTNTSSGCQYVAAVLSETEGWSDVQCAFNTPADVQVLPPAEPEIEILSYDPVVNAEGQAQAEIRWSNLRPEGYKILVQIDNWNVTPAILHMTEITGFAANGTGTVTLDIGANTNTSGGCQYVAAVLSETEGWSDVQCAFNTPADVQVLPPAEPEIEILSYDPVVNAGGQAQVEIRWNNLIPEGYKILVQIDNWNVTPAILHMTEITGFEANGTRTVTLDIGADTNTSGGCQYVAAVLSETEGWSDVQCAFNTPADVQVTQ